MVGSVSGAALRDFLSMSSSGSHTLSDFGTSATVPAKQVFFVYSLDNVATTAADEQDGTHTVHLMVILDSC